MPQYRAPMVGDHCCRALPIGTLAAGSLYFMVCSVSQHSFSELGMVALFCGTTKEKPMLYVSKRVINGAREIFLSLRVG